MMDTRGWGKLPQSVTVKDWETTNPDCTGLVLYSNVKDYTPLPEFSKLRHLVAATVTPERLGIISSLTNLESLTVMQLRKVEDLCPLANLTKLTLLSLGLGQREWSLEPLRGLVELRMLSVCAPMSVAVNGGQLFVDSFEPLGDLTKMEKLQLFALKPRRGDISPLMKLQALRELDLMNAFSVEEFAGLAGALPGANGLFRQPFYVYEHSDDYILCSKCKSRDRVLLIGKARPRLLCPECDAKRLQQHVEKYEAIRRRAAVAFGHE